MSMSEAVSTLEGLVSPLIALMTVVYVAVFIYYFLTKMFGISISRVLKRGWD